jgi:hypothetical protein
MSQKPPNHEKQGHTVLVRKTRNGQYTFYDQGMPKGVALKDVYKYNNWTIRQEYRITSTVNTRVLCA